jgi:hypothetical protein
VNDALLVVIGLGVLAGGSILVIDSLIIRRLRRSRNQNDQDERQT